MNNDIKKTRRYIRPIIFLLLVGVLVFVIFPNLRNQTNYLYAGISFVVVSFIIFLLKRKDTRRWGDRKDGKLLRKSDPFMRIIPHIMPVRTGASVGFQQRIYINETEKLVRKLRKEEGLKVGFLHVLVAAAVRTFSQKPHINRFVAGGKVYARNEISISMVVKKEMSYEAEETTVKFIFDPKDTVYDVVNKINAEVEGNKGEDKVNDTDKTAKIIMLLPQFLIRIVFWLIKFLDNRGWLPKFLFDVSPFHTSLFITDLGSLGIGPAYHHLYDLGTTSFFVAFGTKGREKMINYKGEEITKKYVDAKIMVDERISDGFYNASSIKYFFELISDPEVLLTPPEKVVVDDEI